MLESTRSHQSYQPSGLVQQADKLLRADCAALVPRLVRLEIAPEPRMAEQLIAEVRRYLLLASSHEELRIPMYSQRVDAAWHQLVLFTEHYSAFCRDYFGHYLHHAPREAERPVDQARTTLSFDAFASLYAQTFGTLPDVWFDERTLESCTRLAWASDLEPRVESSGEHAILCNARDDSELCRVPVRARDALAFMAGQRRFLVRELSVLSRERDRTALCEPLVRFRILELAL
ncbi:MAG: hypothetical protein JWN04_2215 [Myxococcaceae bacterium]|nr:hypothetical protein [Myxococcaceae bacterium]